MTDSTTEQCVFLFLTEHCNLSCRHCYVWAGPMQKPSMPWNVFDSALDFCDRFNIRDIRLTGGEPTAHPGFHELVETLFVREFKVRLITNGMSLIRSGKLEDVLKKLDRCWISIYGPSERIHQSVTRGRGLPLIQLIEAVAGMEKAGHNIGLSVLIIPGSTEQVGSFLDLALAKGIQRIRFVPLQPDGRAATEMPYDWASWPHELASLNGELMERQRQREFRSLSLNTPFPLDAAQPVGIQSCLLRQRRMWSVVPSGDVFPCCFTVYDETLRVGNVLDADVARRLTHWTVEHAHAPLCRGLRREFWKLKSETQISCPISNTRLGGES